MSDPTSITPAEAAAIDASGGTSQERFFLRIALHGIRVLQTVAADTDTSLEDLSRRQVIAWFEADAQRRVSGQAKLLVTDDQAEAFPDDRPDDIGQTALSGSEKFLLRSVVGLLPVVAAVRQETALADLSGTAWIERLRAHLQAQAGGVFFVIE
ncbi:MAG: hypothetical protein HC918_06075 [Oscillatoriales cyanobacterium SM2_1_8]|nr:hypothetical protein [Oscillatoriales cyanobacterium SM2_1_8]